MLRKLLKIKDESIIAARSGLGMWSFLAQRITGLGLIFYLLMHITVISTSLKGPDPFNKLLGVLTSPLFVALDLGLLAAIVVHLFNGARILLFDMGIGIRWQKLILWIAMLTAAAIWLTTLYITIPHILGK